MLPPDLPARIGRQFSLENGPDGSPRDHQEERAGRPPLSPEPEHLLVREVSPAPQFQVNRPGLGPRAVALAGTSLYVHSGERFITKENFETMFVCSLVLQANIRVDTDLMRMFKWRKVEMVAVPASLL